MRSHVRRWAVAVASLSLLAVPGVMYASLTPSLTQTINAGTLTADIYQSDDKTPVTSPSVSFGAQNYSFNCQTSTATLGDSSNKINVTNLASSINTWNLAIAATGGVNATWTSGGNSYKYDDPAGSPAGCTNGQLTVNPTVGTLTDDCSSTCTANDATVSKGSSTALTTSTSSATLMSDSAGTSWEGFLTGVGLSQTIPALTPSGSYSLPMTITLTHT